ncbi:MAG TPA: 4-hydroxy-3-methylbut-2-enyl diphosphate reductase [Bacilli bacterium]|nr:4-hydroxy-3-methylbut-2-enyl diphosphate reductase [Bacilli bacterium]HPS19293.1 4-hydroxy-3-methylbut-2-enyl diphosphate reductase [Bacilli bacterium]
MKITILEPKGYCAGVNQAISLALSIKEKHPRQAINVLGMLVHNSYVIAFLKQHGIGMIENIEDAPAESVLIFTAHGHEKEHEQIAREKKLIIYDAVCPLVKKNLSAIIKEEKHHHQVIYIGYVSHPETAAATSYTSNIFVYPIDDEFNFDAVIDPSPLVINQTTLNFLSLNEIHQEIKKHFPNARFTNEICQATRSRQEALFHLDEDVDAIIIVGSEKSSNAKRLYEIALSRHPEIDVLLIENPEQLPRTLLKNKKHIVISSSASTPLSLIEEIQNSLANIK